LKTIESLDDACSYDLSLKQSMIKPQFARNKKQRNKKMISENTREKLDSLSST
jgi:hypothetical protein